MEDGYPDFETLEAALRDAFHGRYAGLWVEDSGGPLPDLIHIAVAALEDGDAEAAREVLARRAPGVAHLLHSVAHSEQALQAYVSPFLSLAAEGDLPDGLTGIGIDVTRNAVVVYVSSPPTGRLAEMISHIPDDAVQLSTESYRPLGATRRRGHGAER